MVGLTARARRRREQREREQFLRARGSAQHDPRPQQDPLPAPVTEVEESAVEVPRVVVEPVETPDAIVETPEIDEPEADAGPVDESSREVAAPEAVAPPAVLGLADLFLVPEVEPTHAAEPARRRWWRRRSVVDAPVEPDAADLVVDADEDPEPIVDPAAAVAGDDEVAEAAVQPVHVDRRRERRARRRGGRRAVGVPLESAEDLLDVDPAAAVAAEAEPAAVAEAEPEVVAAEPEADLTVVEAVEPVEPDSAPERDGVSDPYLDLSPDPEPAPELTPDADLSMHVLEVPPDADGEFVRDFLRDVQFLVHGGVPTQEQVEDAEDRKDEEWLPGEWVVDREPRTERGRRRASEAKALPVVRPPDVPRRRRTKAKPKRSARLVRYTLVVLLIGSCAALPWVVPQVPDWFASAVPEQSPTPGATDPSILPVPTPTGPVPTPEPTFTDKQLLAAGKPLEVWVPRLQVRSPVVPISGQSGELVPPDDAQILGWWQEGHGAGAKRGTAVVTGHTVSTGGGAFDNLGKLVPGDRLRVRTSLGWITYVVEDARDYSVASLAKNAAKIFDQDGVGRLVLITCSDFNGEIYLSNAVVTATPVGDEPFPVAGEGTDPGAEVPDGGLGQPWDDPSGNTGDDPGVQLTEKPF